MPSSTNKRMLLLFALIAAIIFIPTYWIISPQSPAQRLADEPDFQFHLLRDGDSAGAGDSREGLSDITVMGKMKNETAKAEVGRAGWKLLHTMAARYPDHPTEDERKTFKDFLHLFSRMYPCGECATHFQALLKEFNYGGSQPPQTSSKTTAGLYLCMLHNKVNLRLKKEEFDCTKLDYDCGCGDESTTTDKTGKAPQVTKKSRLLLEKGSPDGRRIDPVTGEELVHG